VSRGVRGNTLAKASERHPNGRLELFGVKGNSALSDCSRMTATPTLWRITVKPIAGLRTWQLAKLLPSRRTRKPSAARRRRRQRSNTRQDSPSQSADRIIGFAARSFPGANSCDSHLFRQIGAQKENSSGRFDIQSCDIRRTEAGCNSFRVLRRCPLPLR
jgi:hypothetical protein